MNCNPNLRTNQPQKNVEPITIVRNQFRLFDLSEVEVVLIEVLNPAKNFCDSGTRNENRSVPVMNNTVLDLDLGVCLAASLHSGDVRFSGSDGRPDPFCLGRAFEVPHKESLSPIEFTGNTLLSQLNVDIPGVECFLPEVGGANRIHSR